MIFLELFYIWNKNVNSENVREITISFVIRENLNFSWSINNFTIGIRLGF